MSVEHRNRLADEPSLYLQQHGANPVDWFPWGDEALSLSKQHDKPILLSIGYSACHWCHVMEHESFENPQIADAMNRLFVCIKVDREERPDIDGLYMKTVQMMTGHGGWPMTVFLTPDLKPFYAGTYFPPVDRGQMPGFPRVLMGVAKAYAEQREQIEERADHVAELLDKAQRGHEERRSLGADNLEADIRDTALRLAGAMDEAHGGFGKAPKFPNTLALSLVADSGVPEAERLVKLSLDKMAAGGIYDHLGGGFHRYSVDQVWLVPHFEKMLYDQAALCEAYIDGWKRFGEPGYLGTVSGILDYVLREMQDEQGGFYATQDADSEGEEGKFFVWTPAEVADVVGSEDADLVCRYFDVSDVGNFEGKNILHLTVSLDEVAAMFERDRSEVARVLEDAAAKLFEARGARIPPATDQKHLADWNGMMVRAAVRASRALDRDDYLEAAEKAARFVRDKMRDGDSLHHFHANGASRVAGFVDDYAWLGTACVELFYATLSEEWLNVARWSADALIDRFEDPENGGFYFTAEGAEAPILRNRELLDSAVPSGNAVAIDFLARLYQLTGDDRYRAASERGMDGLLDTALANPHGGALLLATALRMRRGYTTVVVTHAESVEGRALVRRVLELPLGEVDVAAFPGNADAEWLPGPIAGKTTGEAAAFVCRGPSCLAPISDPGELESALTSIG